MAGRVKRSRASKPKEPDAPDAGEAEALISKALPIILPIAASFLAATALAMLRNSYVKFYGAFGVTPEDVGISQTQVLSGIFHFCLGGAFLRTHTPEKVAVLIGLLVLVWWLVAHFCYTSLRIQRRVPGNLGRIVVAVAMYFILLILALIGFGTIVIPKDHDLAHKRITGSEALRSEELSLLTIHAFPAQVVIVDKSVPGLPAPNAAVMYLGRNESTTILYDPTSETTLRVPTGLIAVRLQRQPLSVD